MNKKKSNSNLYFILLGFIIIVIVLYALLTMDEISITNIKWNSNGNICNVSFYISNESQKSYMLQASIKLFTFRRSHNDHYTLIGDKNVTIRISPKEQLKIEEKVSIEVIESVKQVQVLVNSKKELKKY
jgi:hypothetical protein